MLDAEQERFLGGALNAKLVVHQKLIIPRTAINIWGNSKSKSISCLVQIHSGELFARSSYLANVEIRSRIAKLARFPAREAFAYHNKITLWNGVVAWVVAVQKELWQGLVAKNSNWFFAREFLWRVVYLAN